MHINTWLSSFNHNFLFVTNLAVNFGWNQFRIIINKMVNHARIYFNFVLHATIWSGCFTPSATATSLETLSTQAVPELCTKELNHWFGSQRIPLPSGIGIWSDCSMIWNLRGPWSWTQTWTLLPDQLVVLEMFYLLRIWFRKLTEIPE